MATKEQLLEGIDVRELPARRWPDEALTPEPLVEVAVGDMVVVYSRGSTRVAKVLAVTPKRVMVAYTTEGAWDMARKIHESALHRALDEKAVRRVEESNFDYYEREANVTTRQYTHTEEHLAEFRARIEEGKDAYVERKLAEGRADVERRREEARAGGVEQYVHVTTKSVKREDVYGMQEVE